MLIFGLSGYAKVVHDLARASGVTVIGYIDHVSAAKEFAGLQVLEEAEALRHPAGEVMVAVTNPETRRAVAERFASHGWKTRTLIHPKATVADPAAIGPGSVVLAGAVVHPGVIVGAGAIINANATVDHDCQLGDYVHIAPGAAVGNGAKIGVGAWIGINACVIEDITVGAGTMVGAGATVVENLPDEVVAYGVPARVHRQGRYFAAAAAAPAPAAKSESGGQVRDTVADVINTILRDTGRETRSFENQDVLMGNIGLDSLDLAVMTVSLEQRTGLDPFRSGRGAVRSFGELVAVYEESLAGSAK